MPKLIQAVGFSWPGGRILRIGRDVSLEFEVAYLDHSASINPGYHVSEFVRYLCSFCVNLAFRTEQPSLRSALLLNAILKRDKKVTPHPAVYGSFFWIY
jgi:hypothetical protein